MEADDLPLWLLGIQAAILVAAGDAALAARALPDATARELRGHPAAFPVEGWKPLSRRIKDERRATLRQHLEYTGSRPPRMRKEPLSASQRAQFAGEPLEWNGFSLTYLAIRTGSWPEPHIKRLVEAARAGHVRTIDPKGNTIGPEVWSRHWLREVHARPGVLIMVPDPYHQIDEDAAVEPLFNRDDVLQLISPGKPKSRVKPESRGASLHKRIREWYEKVYPAGTAKPKGQLVKECMASLGLQTLSDRTFRRALGGK
jgi:hypothetical protein